MCWLILPLPSGGTRGRRYPAGQGCRHHPDGLTELSASGLPLLLPHLDKAPGSHVRIRIAATDVIIATQAPAGLSALNVLPGTVDALRLAVGPAQSCHCKHRRAGCWHGSHSARSMRSACTRACPVMRLSRLWPWPPTTSGAQRLRPVCRATTSPEIRQHRLPRRNCLPSTWHCHQSTAKAPCAPHRPGQSARGYIALQLLLEIFFVYPQFFLAFRHDPAEQPCLPECRAAPNPGQSFGSCHAHRFRCGVDRHATHACHQLFDPMLTIAPPLPASIMAGAHACVEKNMWRRLVAIRSS